MSRTEDNKKWKLKNKEKKKEQNKNKARARAIVGTPTSNDCEMRPTTNSSDMGECTKFMYAYMPHTASYWHFAFNQINNCASPSRDRHSPHRYQQSEKSEKNHKTEIFMWNSLMFGRHFIFHISSIMNFIFFRFCARTCSWAGLCLHTHTHIHTRRRHLYVLTWHNRYVVRIQKKLKDRLPKRCVRCARARPLCQWNELRVPYVDRKKIGHAGRTP